MNVPVLFVFFCNDTLSGNDAVVLPCRVWINGNRGILNVKFRNFWKFLFKLVRHFLRDIRCDLYHGPPAVDQAQFFGCGSAEIHDISFGIWASVRNGNDYFFVIYGILYLQHGAEREFQMGTRHAVTVVWPAVAHCSSV